MAENPESTVESDGEDDDEYESEGEESDDEEKEPQLKYRRLGGSLHRIFNSQNRASAFCVGRKFLALGTNKGYLFVLDFDGNTNKQHQYRHHKSAILDISCDAREEYIGTCSGEGKVVIYSLFRQNVRYEYKYPGAVYAVCLDPNFSRKKDLPFFCGGAKGQLVLTKKGFFRNKETIIHKDEGPIYSIKMHGNLLAWSNAKGVKVIDMSTNQRICRVEKSASSGAPGEYRCNMVWTGDGKELELIVGWGKIVQILRIMQKKKEEEKKTLVSSVEYFVETKVIEVDYWICGISPYKNGQLIILSYEEEEEGVVPKPELRILDLEVQDELSIDTLMIKDYEQYKPSQYLFSSSGEDNLFYVVSEMDIVIAEPRNVDDHIKWLLRQNKFAEALFEGKEKESELKLFTVKTLGEAYLTHLIKNNLYEKAAQLVPKIAGTDKETWEKWVYKFVVKKQNIKHIIPYIPIENPILNPGIYYTCLTFFLHEDPVQFLSNIAEWPNTLYDIHKVTDQVEAVITAGNYSNEMLNVLQTSLSKLYVYQDEHEKAVNVLFELRNSSVFSFIETHSLLKFLQDKLLDLLDFNSARTLELLLKYKDHIKIENVINQLQTHSKEKELLEYLEIICEKNEDLVKDYHIDHIKLLCQYKVRNLRGFLEKTQTYNIDDALDICENYFNEAKDKHGQKYLLRSIIYLYQRMGSPSDALGLILSRLKEEIVSFKKHPTEEGRAELMERIEEDMELAVDVVENDEDPELWKELISKTIEDPLLISDLLKNISKYVGVHIDPVDLIKQIPNNLVIEKLKMKIISIVENFALQKTLQVGCKEILDQDLKILSLELHREQRRPTKFEISNQSCSVCRNFEKKEDCLYFFCGHIYHVSCYHNATKTTKRRGPVFCLRCFRK